MKNKTTLFRKLLCFVMALTLVTVFSAGTIGVSAGIFDKVKWSLDDNGSLLIYGEGDMTPYSEGGAPWYSKRNDIYSVIVADGITSISSFAFADCYNVNNVVIRNMVTSIGHYAFYKCTSLTEIEIPSSVKSIGFRAFNKCDSLESVFLSEGVTEIENRAFEDCTSLAEIVIPESLYSIDVGSFINCNNLKKVIVPDTISTVGMNAFLNCYPIKLYCNAGSEAERYAKENRIPYVNGNEPEIIAVGQCGETAGWTLFADGTIIISGTGEMGKFTTFQRSYYTWSSFKDYVRDIIISDGITKVNEGAFLNSAGIWTVSVSADVEEIGDMAFGYYDRGTKKINEMIIYCYRDSAGEQYAIDNDFYYEYLDPHEYDPILKDDSPYEIRDGYIFGVKLNTPVEEFISHFNAKISVFNCEGKIAEDGFVGTDFHVKVNDIVLTVVVIGDITGDGEADSADAVAILKHDADFIVLEGALFYAADLNGDFDIDSFDAKMILMYDAGMIEL